MKTEEFEKAIRALYQPPALDYIRYLRSALDQEPEYLKLDQKAITLKITELLGSSRTSWSLKTVQRFAMKLVWEAVVRLRCVENARTSAGKIAPRGLSAFAKL